MNEEEERREKRIDRQWGLLDAIAQGYCQNPEFASTDYEPLADMIVRTANAVTERILQDPRIKATDAIKKGDVIESKTKMITVEKIRTSKNGIKVFEACRSASQAGRRQKVNVFFAKFWIRVVRSMKNLPMSVREALAKVIARILWLAIPKRRHVIETNLRLCFPELSESERRSLAHRVYVRLARAAVDHGTLWESDKETIQKFVTFEGLENLLENKGEPIIVVAPHFAGLDAAGIALNTYVRGVSLYQKQSNPAWDEAVLAGRKRFSDPVLIAKSNESDLRPVLRAIKAKLTYMVRSSCGKFRLICCCGTLPEHLLYRSTGHPD